MLELEKSQELHSPSEFRPRKEGGKRGENPYLRCSNFLVYDLGIRES